MPPPTSYKKTVWLVVPPEKIQSPLLWKLAQEFPIVTHLHHASIREHGGLINVTLEGLEEDIDHSISWLEQEKIQVEPLEVGTIEG
jgi:hypothetical protein